MNTHKYMTVQNFACHCQVEHRLIFPYDVDGDVTDDDRIISDVSTGINIKLECQLKSYRKPILVKITSI